MANAFTRNPVYIDTTSSDIDIANLAFGSSQAGVFINGVRFVNPTLNDKIVIKDAGNNVVMELTADATGKDVSLLETQHHVHTIGLKMLTADQTRTTGHVLIYVK